MIKIDFKGTKRTGTRRRTYVIHQRTTEARGIVTKTMPAGDSTQTGTPSLGELVGLFERLYLEGKLKSELMTPAERRSQVTRTIADAKAFKEKAEHKLKRYSL
jgi:hypothetical protein